ncbi:unnamed protein product, partial [Ectocarpus sp. 12 AP-2014]
EKLRLFVRCSLPYGPCRGTSFGDERLASFCGPRGQRAISVSLTNPCSTSVETNVEDRSHGTELLRAGTARVTAAAAAAAVLPSIRVYGVAPVNVSKTLQTAQNSRLFYRRVDRWNCW